MLVLGLDPGATTGWCLYDTDARRVVDSDTFKESEAPSGLIAMRRDICVIERPVAHGPTRPQVVDCAWHAGKLAVIMQAVPMTRREIKLILTEATQRDVVVKDDATAWAALVLLHGEGCDAKPSKKNGPGGSIGRVTSHERAALALVVAWAMHAGVWKP